MLLTIAGEKSAGAFLGNQAQLYATGVRSIIVKGSGHWLIDERPTRWCLHWWHLSNKNS